MLMENAMGLSFFWSYIFILYHVTPWHPLFKTQVQFLLLILGGLQPTVTPSLGWSDTYGFCGHLESCVYTHAHACTQTHTHSHFKEISISFKDLFYCLWVYLDVCTDQKRALGPSLELELQVFMEWDLVLGYWDRNWGHHPCTPSARNHLVISPAPKFLYSLPSINIFRVALFIYLHTKSFENSFLFGGGNTSFRSELWNFKYSLYFNLFRSFLISVVLFCDFHWRIVISSC